MPNLLTCAIIWPAQMMGCATAVFSQMHCQVGWQNDLPVQFAGRSDVATTVAQMTKGELRDVIEAAVEHKLLELLGDPDEGLPVRKSVRDRLLRQKRAVSAGERGESFEDVVRRLGLE
jgi:hypothetical protein